MMISTTDDECRSDTFGHVRSFVRSSVHSCAQYGLAIAPSRHRDLPYVFTYVFKPHEPDLQYTYHQDVHRPKKTKKHPPSTHTSTRHDRSRAPGERVMTNGRIRRVMTRSIDRPRSIDRVLAKRDSTRDATRRRTNGAARRVERRRDRGATPGIGGEIARVTEQVRLERSNDRASRARRRHSPHAARASSEWRPRLTVCLPLDARARRMDRMRRMSASGDGTMSARKQAPSSARRLSRPSAYGACDARWDDDSMRARWKRTNE